VLFACLVISGGALGDRLGRKGVLLTGLVVFAAGAAASAAAPTATVMLVGRAVSGIGAACVLPNTLAVLLHATPRERRSTAIGVWASTTGVGGVIGNVGGGAVLSSGSWRWLFISIVPLSLVCALLIAAFVPRSSRADRTLQPFSATLLTAATVVLLIGIIQGPQSGWASWQVLGSFGVAVLLFGAWIACELRAAHPMLDPRLFRIPLLRGAALGTMVIFFAMFALFYVNASYLQYAKDYGVLRTGFAVLPLAVIMIARLASSFSGWIGRQGTDALAFGLVGVGLLLLSNCGTSTAYSVYASYLLVVGAGLALALPGLAADITSSLPPEQAGVGSGLQSTTRELGSALGVAVVGTVMTARFTAGLPAGLTNGAGGYPTRSRMRSALPTPTNYGSRSCRTSPTAWTSACASWASSRCSLGCSFWPSSAKRELTVWVLRLAYGVETLIEHLGRQGDPRCAQSGTTQLSSAPAWPACSRPECWPNSTIASPSWSGTSCPQLDPNVLGGEGVRISNGTLTHRYGGGLQLLEHGQMLVTLAGYQGNHPPVDPEGFTAFAAQLPTGLYKVIQQAEPLSDPIRFTFPVSRRCQASTQDPRVGMGGIGSRYGEDGEGHGEYAGRGRGTAQSPRCRWRDRVGLGLCRASRSRSARPPGLASALASPGWRS
jgi:MFS family permease